MSTNKGEYGEGNYKASRQYNEKTKAFVESGKVDDAAQGAAPQDEIEAAEMANAEAEGRRRAKEEDPALKRGVDKPEGQPVPERPANQTTTPKPGQEGH